MLGARGAVELVDEKQLVEERREQPRKEPNEVTPLIGEERSADYAEDEQEENGDDYYDTIGSSMSCDQREGILLEDEEYEDDDGESSDGRPMARPRRPRSLIGFSKIKKDEDTETIDSSQSGENTEKKKRKWPKVPKVPKNLQKNLQKMPRMPKFRRLKLPKLPGQAEANIRECNEFTAPLMAAAKEGNLQEVKRLVEIGHDVNIREPDDTTPLMYAAEYGHPR